MKTKLLAALGATALSVSLLTACGSSAHRDYEGICVDNRTSVRVDDSQCNGGSNGSAIDPWFAYWYILLLHNNTYIPPLGAHPTTGSYKVPPRSATIVKNAPPQGGTVKQPVKPAAPPKVNNPAKPGPANPANPAPKIPAPKAPPKVNIPAPRPPVVK